VSTALALRVVEAQARGYRRVWKGTMVTAFINPVLFLLAMGQGLGSMVEQGVGDVTYIAFIAPALMATTAMQTAAVESTWPVMAGMKWLKTYHGALATPVGTTDLVAGNLVWIAVRIAMACTAFALVTGLLGVVDLSNMIVAIPAGMLTGMAFAAPLMAFTAVAKNENRLSSIFRFAIIPMFLFSGTFFPIEQLPAWMQPIAYFTPLWHGVDLCRSIAIGVSSDTPAIIHVAYLVLWAAAGWFVATTTFRKTLVV
jgi:lipooligosaccharide transport system permease protein